MKLFHTPERRIITVTTSEVGQFGRALITRGGLVDLAPLDHVSERSGFANRVPVDLSPDKTSLLRVSYAGGYDPTKGIQSAEFRVGGQRRWVAAHILGRTITQISTEQIKEIQSDFAESELVSPLLDTMITDTGEGSRLILAIPQHKRPEVIVLTPPTILRTGSMRPEALASGN